MLLRQRHEADPRKEVLQTDEHGCQVQVADDHGLEPTLDSVESVQIWGVGI